MAPKRGRGDIVGEDNCRTWFAKSLKLFDDDDKLSAIVSFRLEFQHSIDSLDDKLKGYDVDVQRVKSAKKIKDDNDSFNAELKEHVDKQEAILEQLHRLSISPIASQADPGLEF